MDYLWLIFALLSAFTAALVGIFGKIGLEGIDANTATAIRAVVMALFLIGVVIMQGKLSHISSIVSNNKAMLYIFLSGIAGALSWLFYFIAIKLGKVSQVVPIDRLSVVFAIVLAFLILGEKISLKTGIGAALIASGAIIIALG
ncbi:EamA family transporter [Candidatus Woesearchaeota archaeon]|nr:EamA family transporter [Candidatus Woesearchaeota archaeon]